MELKAEKTLQSRWYKLAQVTNTFKATRWEKACNKSASENYEPYHTVSVCALGGLCAH